MTHRNPSGNRRDSKEKRNAFSPREQGKREGQKVVREGPPSRGRRGVPVDGPSRVGRGHRPGGGWRPDTVKLGRRGTGETGPGTVEGGVGVLTGRVGTVGGPFKGWGHGREGRLDLSENDD